MAVRLGAILSEMMKAGRDKVTFFVSPAVASFGLRINPLVQPNVEAAKVLARKMVAGYIAGGELPRGDSVSPSSDALDRFLSQARPGDYVALQAYLQPTPEIALELADLRMWLRDRTGLATTVGFGPRFLHSTGQVHKGDAGHSLFVQLTADDLREVAIPDEAGAPVSSITFGILKEAQALGDQRALLDADRRVIRFHLGKDVMGGLQRLLAKKC